MPARSGILASAILLQPLSQSFAVESGVTVALSTSAPPSTTPRAPQTPAKPVDVLAFWTTRADFDRALGEGQ